MDVYFYVKFIEPKIIVDLYKSVNNLYKNIFLLKNIILLW